MMAAALRAVRGRTRRGLIMTRALSFIMPSSRLDDRDDRESSVGVGVAASRADARDAGIRRGDA
jgi:hypothetical protein